LNSGSELLARDVLEAEEQIIQRTIVMIFPQRPRNAGPAFINGTPGDGETGEAFARTVRGLFGEVSGDERNARNVIIFHVWFNEGPSRVEGKAASLLNEGGGSLTAAQKMPICMTALVNSEKSTGFTT
jgi:hypothetical protein